MHVYVCVHVCVHVCVNMHVLSVRACVCKYMDYILGCLGNELCQVFTGTLKKVDIDPDLFEL